MSPIHLILSRKTTTHSFAIILFPFEVRRLPPTLDGVTKLRQLRCLNDPSHHLYYHYRLMPLESSLRTLLKECISLRHARILHQKLLSLGAFFPFPPPPLAAELVAAYAAGGGAAEAQSAIENLSPASTFCWNLLIKHEACRGLPDRAFSLCTAMRRHDSPLDGFTFPYLLKACSDLRSHVLGASIHAVVSRQGFGSNVFVCNALVAMYGRCSVPSDARRLFEEMLDRGVDDVVSWNSMVASHAQNGELSVALETFAMMCYSSSPDEISLVNVLPACASLQASAQGKQVHGFAYRRGLFCDLFVGNAIVDMYAKCGMMKESLAVFELMEVKDVVSWNAMVTGYSQNSDFGRALELIDEMHLKKIPLNVVTWSAVIAGYAQRGMGHQSLGVFRRMQSSNSYSPNAITLISILSACAAIGARAQGMEIHAYSLRRCLISWKKEEEDLMVLNAVIDMYCKCRSFDRALAVFDQVPFRERSVVTWTVMVGGYAQHGDANSALEFFSQLILHGEHVSPNAFTISCALMAAARLAALQSGRQLHAYVLRRRFQPTGTLHMANCLIDMYSKCGDVEAARGVFDGMPQRNTVTWASLMSGYGAQGRGKEVLYFFNRMMEARLRPDGVVFLILLYACSHSGMVDQGLSFFRAMAGEFGVTPGPEHYACAVDILGRAGRLQEAEKLIEEMPMEPTPVVWVALLSACRIHSDLRLAERASSELIQIGFDYDGSYTLLSNIYAKEERWQDVARIRRQMRQIGIRKRPGCSWIEGKRGATTTFYAGDRTNPQSDQIYGLLSSLIERIRALGYAPQTSFALHDVDEEEKNSLLMEHSEKLALAFGILVSRPGAPIRITKNLRVCGDCHCAITFISAVVDHEIVVRDSSRFHRFKSGSCSCGGYW